SSSPYITSLYSTLPRPCPQVPRYVPQYQPWVQQGRIVGHRQVVPPIAVEVGYGDGVRTGARRREGPCCLKGAIPVAQQHRDDSSVGHRQVGPPIAVKVGHGHGGGSCARNREGPCRLEAAIAVA